MSGEHGHDDHHDHEGHINTIAPFVFSLASAIMFIGLVMATAGEIQVIGSYAYLYLLE